MSRPERGRTRSLEVPGGPAQAPARSMLRAMGWPTEDLQLPQVGVAATWNRAASKSSKTVSFSSECLHWLTRN